MRRASWVLSLSVLLVGCGGADTLDAGESADAATSVDAGQRADAGSVRVDDAGSVDAGELDAGLAVFTVTELDAGVVMTNGRAYRYRLLRLEVPGQAPAYAQYLPPEDGGTRPIVVMTQPYGGIGWTGEEVDQRWEAQGGAGGLFPDVDAPGFSGDAGDAIVYQPFTPQLGADQAFFFLFHGVGVLHVFGRFYAGGSIENDVQDMVAGFRFLEQEPTVDRQHLGIFGGSWGGFESMYASMRAPPTVRPAVNFSAYPLTDFEQELHMVTHLDERFSTAVAQENAARFFAPYLRRIRPVTDREGFTRWNAAAVLAELQTPTMILHDTWDTLVPFAQTQALLDAGVVQACVVSHPGSPDWDQLGLAHFTVTDEAPDEESAVLSFAVSHLLTTLLPPQEFVIVPVEGVKLRAFLESQHDHRPVGETRSGLATLLLELTDARVYVLDASANMTFAGADWVAAELNAVWGTSFDAATARAQLQTGALP